MAVDVGAALRDLILAEDTGGFFGGRIYPQYRAQLDTVPAVIYSVSSGRGLGTFEDPVDLALRRFTYTVVADDYADGETGVDLIRFALDHYKGTTRGVTFQGVFFATPNEDYVPPVDAADRGWHLVHHDYEVWYVQPLKGA